MTQRKFKTVATALYSEIIVLERDCISSLKSYGEALKMECCFPGVLCDGGDSLANFLSQHNGHVVPRASCIHGKWV